MSANDPWGNIYQDQNGGMMGDLSTNIAPAPQASTPIKAKVNTGQQTSNSLQFIAPAGAALPDGSVSDGKTPYTVGNLNPQQLSGAATPELQQLLQAGGVPVVNGQPLNQIGTGPGGGALFAGPDGKPTTLYQLAGYDTNGTVAQAVAAWQQNPNAPLSSAAAALVPGYKPPAPGGTNTNTGKSNSGLIGNLDNPNLPLVPGIDLGAAPHMATSLPGDVTQGVSDLTKQVSDAIGGQFTQAQQNMPQAQAAQTNLSSVPQTSMTGMPISDQVAQMLTGNLGYSPQILAQMKANATDSTAQSGQMQMAQAERALEQNGLGGGGLDSAVRQDIARQTGAANTTAQNAIDVKNADVAEGNFQTGVADQQNVLQDNFQMANQLALENANKLFAAIQQNTQNTQATNTQNAGAAQSLNAKGAEDKASFDASQGSTLTNANLKQASDALLTNNQNDVNQKLNQAQLDRQQAVTNLGANQNQWQTANTLLSGFSPVNQFNPQQTFSPVGATLQNVGSGILNGATKALAA